MLTFPVSYADEDTASLKDRLARYIAHTNTKRAALRVTKDAEQGADYRRDLAGLVENIDKINIELGRRANGTEPDYANRAAVLVTATESLKLALRRIILLTEYRARNCINATAECDEVRRLEDEISRYMDEMGAVITAVSARAERYPSIQDILRRQKDSVDVHKRILGLIEPQNLKGTSGVWDALWTVANTVLGALYTVTIAPLVWIAKLVKWTLASGITAIQVAWTKAFSLPTSVWSGLTNSLYCARCALEEAGSALLRWASAIGGGDDSRWRKWLQWAYGAFYRDRTHFEFLMVIFMGNILLVKTAFAADWLFESYGVANWYTYIKHYSSWYLYLQRLAASQIPGGMWTASLVISAYVNRNWKKTRALELLFIKHKDELLAGTRTKDQLTAMFLAGDTSGYVKEAENDWNIYYAGMLKTAIGLVLIAPYHHFLRDATDNMFASGRATDVSLEKFAVILQGSTFIGIWDNFAAPAMLRVAYDRWWLPAQGAATAADLIERGRNLTLQEAEDITVMVNDPVMQRELLNNNLTGPASRLADTLARYYENQPATASVPFLSNDEPVPLVAPRILLITQKSISDTGGGGDDDYSGLGAFSKADPWTVYRVANDTAALVCMQSQQNQADKYVPDEQGAVVPATASDTRNVIVYATPDKDMLELIATVAEKAKKYEHVSKAEMQLDEMKEAKTAVETVSMLAMMFAESSVDTAMSPLFAWFGETVYNEANAEIRERAANAVATAVSTREFFASVEWARTSSRLAQAGLSVFLAVQFRQPALALPLVPVWYGYELDDLKALLDWPKRKLVGLAWGEAEDQALRTKIEIYQSAVDAHRRENNPV